MARLEFDAVKTMRGVTLYATVKRGTEVKWRVWLGVRLMYMAAWVMNCNIDIEGVANGRRN